MCDITLLATTSTFHSNAIVLVALAAYSQTLIELACIYGKYIYIRVLANQSHNLIVRKPHLKVKYSHP